MKKLFYSSLSVLLASILFSCSYGMRESVQESDDGFVNSIVTIEEAEKELMAVLSEMDKAVTKGESCEVRKIAGKFSKGTPVLTKSTGNVSDPYLHVFNFEDNNGFAIMSGDKRVAPLLVITEEGNLGENLETGNPGFEIFMDLLPLYYRNEINGSALPTSVGPSIVYGKWKDTYYPSQIGECVVKWGQGSPYNMYCPKKINGDTAVTGCVATAVAQLMSMYEYPSSYKGYVFHWDSINDSQKPDTEQDKSEVARLMQQLGLKENLKMDYKLNEPNKGSYAYPDKIPDALRNFGYSNGGVYKDFFKTDLILPDLMSGYPVLVGGRTYDDEGHRWLVNALYTRERDLMVYDQLGNLISKTTNTWHYLRCNMGWNSISDGYYLSGVFDTNHVAYEEDEDGSIIIDTKSPIDEDGFYNYHLNAVIGIRL